MRLTNLLGEIPYFGVHGGSCPVNPYASKIWRPDNSSPYDLRIYLFLDFLYDVVHHFSLQAGCQSKDWFGLSRYLI